MFNFITKDKVKVIYNLLWTSKIKRRSFDTSICLNILRAFLRKFAALTNDMVNTFTSLVTH